MKLNFDFIVKNFDNNSFLNEEKKPLQAYVVIVSCLLSPSFIKIGNSFEKYLLAERIYKEKKIEINDQEYNLITSSLREAFKSDDGINPVVKGSILKQLNQLKNS